MASTRTQDELAREVLGTRLSYACDHVEVAAADVAPIIPTTSIDYYTVDDLMKKYLFSRVDSAISKANTRAGGFGIKIELESFRLMISGGGLILLLTLVTLFMLVIGTHEPLTLVQTLLSK